MTNSAQLPSRPENRFHVSMKIDAGALGRLRPTAWSWIAMRAVTSGLSSFGMPTQMTVRRRRA